MVVLRTSVRAASVPVGYRGERRAESRLDSGSSYLTEVSQNAAARRISNAAMDDTDALMTASKRNDRQLLSDINNRLANASFQQPVVVRRSSISSQSGASGLLHRNKPPLPPSTATSAAAGGGRPPAFGQRFGGGSAAGRRPRYYDDDDDDVNLVPPTPVTTSVIRSSRAASVPPRLPVGASAAGTPNGGSYYYGLPVKYGSYAATDGFDGLIMTPKTRVTPPPGYDYLYRRQMDYVPDQQLPRSRNFVADNKPSLLTPVADLAIRQAHRNLDRIEREMKHSSADKANNSSDGPGRLATKTLMEVGADYLTQPARRSTYRTTPAAGTTTYRGLRTTSLSPARPAHGNSSSYYYSSSSNGVQQPPQLSRRYVSSPARDIIVLDGINGLNGYSYEPLTPLGGGRRTVTTTTTTTIPSSAAAFMVPAVDTEEVRQWVKPLGAMEEITEKTLFPTQMYRTRSAPKPTNNYAGGSSYVSVTPVRRVEIVSGGRTAGVSMSVPSSPRWDKPSPSFDTASIPPGNVRPKVSETRRKVREVLCKVKKDPHYFD